MKNLKKSKLKKFDKSIKIEVSVDLIASKLLKEFKENSPHKEIITNQVIGNLLEEDRLTGLYNALNGWEDVLNFEVGTIVSIAPEKCKVYGYWDTNAIDKLDTMRNDLLFGEIVEINEFSQGNELTLKSIKPWLENNKIIMREITVNINHNYVILSSKEKMDNYFNSLQKELNDYITLQNEAKQASIEA
jgi:hypothetical protein